LRVYAPTRLATIQPGTEGDDVKALVKVLAVAATGCGVLCLPFAEALLVGVGLSGVAAFVCDWEATFLPVFISLALAVVGIGGALVWRGRSKAELSSCKDCQTAKA
jgi:hypothetical protein